MRVVRHLALAALTAATFIGTSAPARVEAQGKTRIFFVEPKNGATVKSPVHLKFGIENYKIAAVPEGDVKTARPDSTDSSGLMSVNWRSATPCCKRSTSRSTRAQASR